MPRHHLSPPLCQSAAPLSHYVETETSGYTAGIIGQRPDTAELVSDDAFQQCDAMLSKSQILLYEQGRTLGDLLHSTVYLTHYGEFTAINEVYARRLSEWYAAHTTVQAAALPRWAPKCRLNH